LVLPAACVGRYVKSQLNIGNCECRELARNSRAGREALVRAIFTAAWSAELPTDMTAVGRCQAQVAGFFDRSDYTSSGATAALDPWQT
jgi:hypothetical protein